MMVKMNEVMTLINFRITDDEVDSFCSNCNNMININLAKFIIIIYVNANDDTTEMVHTIEKIIEISHYNFKYHKKV